MIAPSSHISSALNMRDSCWIRSFALTKAFGPSEKDSDAFAQASAREASKVEALPEARRGSGAVVEAVASPDLLQYNSRDHEKKRAFFRAYLRAARPPPTLQRAIQKKGEEGWFGNKRMALYHSCKGLTAP